MFMLPALLQPLIAVHLLPTKWCVVFVVFSAALVATTVSKQSFFY